MLADAATKETIAESLARFISELRYEDLSSEVINAAKALLLDQLACELVGSTVPWVKPAIALVEMTAGTTGECTVVNYGSRVLASEAAFLNATFGQACEMDDTSYGSSGHVGAATVPVALAMGERGHIDGREFLTAIVAGYEVMYRLMQSINPYHHSRGFHSQSIAGPFAGAAIAGRILGLDQSRLVHALAIAGSHSCGSGEYDQSGGEVKRIHAGLAARGGVQSALLAQFGLTGPPTIIEGKRGFCHIFSPKSDPSVITAGLGASLNIVNTAFKMYPAVATIHTAISAAEKLIAEYAITPESVLRVRVGLPERALLHGAAIGRPREVVEAQFSLAYSIALAIVKRRNVLSDYVDAALWDDPEIVGVIDRVEAYAYPLVEGDKHHMAAVSIDLTDGRSVERTEFYAKGSPPNPASKEELQAKARSLAKTVLDDRRIDRLIAMVDRIEDVPDIADLVSLLVRDTTTHKNN